nr:hypothetical protein [Lachnospiraceae bacterium]
GNLLGSGIRLSGKKLEVKGDYQNGSNKYDDGLHSELYLDGGTMIVDGDAIFASMDADEHYQAIDGILKMDNESDALSIGGDLITCFSEYYYSHTKYNMYCSAGKIKLAGNWEYYAGANFSDKFGVYLINDKDQSITNKSTETLTIPRLDICYIDKRKANIVPGDGDIQITKRNEYAGPYYIIAEQPKDATVETNKTAYFSVKAEGTGFKYLWQMKKKGSSSWSDWTTKTTADISVAYASDKNGMSLRCKVTDPDGNEFLSEPAVLSYIVPFAITTQPKDTTVAPNAMAYFSVKATGNGLKYLWQYKSKGSSTWTDWTSKDTADISVAYSASRDGMSLRCVITDGNGKTLTSNVAVLTYSSGSSTLAITTQPKNTTVAPNELAYFSVKASGSGLTYLWQYKNKGASSWTDWTSKKTAEISVAYSASRNGMSLRCKITDSTGKTVTSNEAVLTYSSGSSTLAITTQPQNATVAPNELAYFSVKASGSSLTYLWQYKNKGASSWTDWTSKKTAEISVAYSASRNGMSLRCVVTDGSGNQVTSNAAVLTYSSGSSTLAITTQPKNATVAPNELAYFSVKASGSGLKYLWQYKNKGASSWTDWTSKKTAEISVAYSKERNGMSLRCVVTDGSGNTVTSNAAVLTYSGSGTLAITTQPQNATVAPNSLAYFSVKASGSGLTYLWQYKNKGASSWTDWTSKKTAEISVAYSKDRDGMSLRCVVTDGSGNKVTSNTAVLTYSSGTFAITNQPQSTTVAANSLAYFSVKARGSGLTYLWQYKYKGSDNWTNWTSKTKPDISVAYSKDRDGMSLRCVITDSMGNTLTSDTAVLNYN